MRSKEYLVNCKMYILSKLDFAKIRYKFIIPITIMVLFTLIIASWISYSDSVKYTSEAMNQNIGDIINIAKATVITPLWQENTEEICANGKAFLQNADVAKIVISDSHKKVVYQEMKNESMKNPRDLFIKSTELKYGKDIAGYIEITMTSKNLKNKSQRDLFREIFTILITLLTVYIVVFIIVGMITKRVAMLIKSIDTIAKGDLTTRVMITSKDEIGQLGAKFNNMADRITGLIGEVNSTASSVAAASQELAASTEDAKENSLQIAANSLSTIDGSLEELHKIEYVKDFSIKMEESFADIVKNIEKSFAISQDARDYILANQANISTVIENVVNMEHIVSTSNDSIELLLKKIGNITDIVAKIENIAKQSQLLSLNATIESARAGDAGKGFVVVAKEISEMAKKTEKLSKETKTVLEEIIESSKVVLHVASKGPALASKSVEIVNVTKDSITNSVGKTKDAESSIELVKIAALEQLQGLRGISMHIAQIQQIIQSTYLHSQQSKDAVASQQRISDEVDIAASELARTAEKLITKTSQFKV